MTADETRRAVVDLLRTRVKKNQYTQGSKRNQVLSEPTGYGDCSSTVRAGYKKILGIDIGSNTVAQIQSRKGFDVDTGNQAAYPNEANLKLGDCLYFKGTDTSRPFAVGHTEMYIGNNQLLGHGSGTGPTIKKMKAYCKNRKANGRGYIKTRRFIAEDEGTNEGGDFIAPADPMHHPAGGIVITGNTVNLRSGPGTGSPIVQTVHAGKVLQPVKSTGWQPVWVDGVVLWVSEKYCEQT